MKRAIARRWAAALDSGEYKQGTGQLRDKYGRFCCLGVLCNLHAQAHPEVAATQTNKRAYFGCTGILPDEVIEWVGMKSDDGEFDDSVKVGIYTHSGCRMHSLVGLNDTAKLTFPEIAKVIRKHWKEL